jgi:ubiquinol-cytochrome c reductase cytochrome b subunit
VFLMVFSAIIFFAPEFGGYFLEYNNFIPADPLKTPRTSRRSGTSRRSTRCCAPSPTRWSTLILRDRRPRPPLAGPEGPPVPDRQVAIVVVLPLAVVAIALLSFDAKFWGVVVMGGAVIILFFLPWLDNSPVRSIRYRPGWHKWVYGVFVVNFFVLGYLGVQPPSPLGERVSQIGTLFYFGFFLLMPWWSRLGEFKPVPDRITFAAH